MKLHIKSTHRPALVTTPNRTKTLIVGGTIVAVNGEDWHHPYCAIMPGGAITLDDIEWEYAWGNDEPDSVTNKIREWKVLGSKGDIYTVREIGSNKFSCDCPHFAYRRQTCKHIREVQ
jgi:hypothetical protein